MLSLDKPIRLLLCGMISLVASVFLHTLGLANILLFFPGAWILSAGSYLFFSSLKVRISGKAVLITGCDSGFGHALAIHLHQLGFRVFAGCLQSGADEDGAERLQRMASNRMHVLQLDITKEDQVNHALHEVKRILHHSEVLWGVVNNAGVSTYGAVEWMPMATFRKLAEVNIFGTISVTKAFLPLVRKAKGRIVNITSAEGRMASALFSAYDLTKFALEGFSDSLRQEMKRFGVYVCLVEPGNFNSGTRLNTDEGVVMFAEQMWSTMDDEVKLDYTRPYFNEVVASRMMVNRSGETNVSPVVEAVEEALTQKFPQARYVPMSLLLLIRVLVSQHLPECIYDFLYA